MTNQLHDTYSLKGTSMEKFFEEIERMDNITHYETIPSGVINLLSVDSENTTSERAMVYQYSANEPRKVRNVNIEKLNKQGADKDLINETINDSKLLLLIGKRLFFTSESMLKTLSSRVNIAGERFYTPTHARNAYIAETMRDKPFNTKLMYRIDDNGVKKVFALFSQRYAVVPQVILKSIIENFTNDESGDESLGKCSCINWEVTNFKSGIYVEFPEKAKDMAKLYGLPDEIIPGLYLATSDVGECSVTAQETWRIKNSLSLGKTYKRVHKGSIDSLSVLSEIKRNIFETYTEVPERLCELLTKEVSDPKKAFKMFFEQHNMSEKVGKDISEKLLSELSAEINPSLSYTAYDIATTIMELPARCSGLCETTMQKLQNVASQAPFADYSCISAADKVYLTA